ncbi:hypothetical protein C6N75_21245, partial [Streptomyces solincola]
MDSAPSYRSLPPREELDLLDRELAWLDTRRSQLLARRAWLLGVLRTSYGAAGRPAPAAGAPAGGEASRRGVRDVLLTLGGTLLAVAAIAFAVVGWDRLGAGGLSAVLTLVTVAALAAPALLLRRGLGATAEALAAVGLVLTVLDVFVLPLVAGAELGAWYAAGGTAGLGRVWA